MCPREEDKRVYDKSYTNINNPMTLNLLVTHKVASRLRERKNKMIYITRVYFNYLEKEEGEPDKDSETREIEAKDINEAFKKAFELTISNNDNIGVTKIDLM